MELHPFLERGQRPGLDLWYVAGQTDQSDAPSQRVGQTMTYVPRLREVNEDGDAPISEGDAPKSAGDIYLIGGANPDGAFNDVYRLCLDTFTWHNLTSKANLKMTPRYEHSAFRSEQHDTYGIYVFGGAHLGSTHNDVQRFDICTEQWETIEVCGGGSQPSARTYHSEHCVTKDGDFVVYSGGHRVADPVGDRQVHMFNISTRSWTTLNTQGSSPKPRHGHCMIAHGNRVYIHGGMSGNTFYNDLFYLDTTLAKWTEVRDSKKRPAPCPRSAHSGVSLKDSIVIFGGMSREGALDDMYSLKIDTHQWTLLRVQGPSPACRLDFSMCVAYLPVCQDEDVSADDTSAASLIPELPATSTADDIVVLGRQAKECLDNEISRYSSAGSNRSVSSSFSSTSSNHAETTVDLPIVPMENQSYQRSQRSSLSSVGDIIIGSESPRKHITDLQEVVVIMGGMDTMGEMFDDCMVISLNI